MNEERGATLPAGRPQPAAWTKVFGTFLVALDPFKLAVAAGGIVATAIGWWLISLVFYYSWTEPNFEDYKKRAVDRSELTAEADRGAWAQKEFDKAFDRWALMHELAGPTERPHEGYARYYQLRHPDLTRRNPHAARGYGGKYRTMPWSEDRGPNPFLLVRSVVSGSSAERQSFVGWFISDQMPNLVEPLIKLLTPVSFLFDARASFWAYVYLLLLIAWLLAVWGFFGGVITRMAVMQLAGKDDGGIREAIRYVRKRYLSYLISPLAPVGFIGFMVLCCMLFGILHWIPVLGDFVDGLLWILPLLAGIAISLTLVGMVGYPMMYTTLSAEGSDTFDAVSRSYNYVYESPWHYLWYSLVAIAYGAVLTLFVVVVGSLTIYFAKWGVSKFPTFGVDRSPEYLFIYAPESLGWKQVLVEKSPLEISSTGEIRDLTAHDRYLESYYWYNHIGAGLASLWVHIVFLLVIGFSYSYFWVASSQIYLLMRKRVDETEFDEVYVEEEPPAAPDPSAGTSQPAPIPTPQAPSGVPVDPPTLKQPDPPPA